MSKAPVLNAIKVINAIINDPDILNSIQAEVDEARLAFHDAHLAFSAFTQMVQRTQTDSILKFLETNNLYVEFTSQYLINRGARDRDYPISCCLRNQTTNSIVSGSRTIHQSSNVTFQIIGKGINHKAAIQNLCQTVSKCTSLTQVGNVMDGSTNIIPLSFSLDDIQFPVGE